MPSPPGASPYVAVVGPARADAVTYERAREVGVLLARRGAVVVCGGLGGVMEAVARGAAREGGTVVGILPGAARGDANGYVTVALATGLGELRNGLVVRSSDVVIAVGGGWGTLSEVALAVPAGVPVVGLGGWSVVEPDGREAAGVVAVASAAEAVAAALGRARESGRRALPP